jgi:hypothetical protein
VFDQSDGTEAVVLRGQVHIQPGEGAGGRSQLCRPGPLRVVAVDKHRKPALHHEAGQRQGREDGRSQLRVVLEAGNTSAPAEGPDERPDLGRGRGRAVVRHGVVEGGDGGRVEGGKERTDPFGIAGTLRAGAQ